MFQDARKTPHVPCFIFMDELESIAQDRTRNQSQQQYKSDFLNTFLSEMDPTKNPNMLIFAATNFKEMIDDAFLRFGRVNFLMLLPELNADGRRAFLEGKLSVIRQEYRKTVEEIVVKISWKLTNESTLKTIEQVYKAHDEILYCNHEYFR
ncbi:ATP-dependent zinc metalloprotease FTSH 4, mitochondrial [Phlyctochytrium bullatum]|nr:ATP-dependent zinc metalloprotease FTSH 4, mitochondrial [Phlyctochytrium bullatum]